MPEQNISIDLLRGPDKISVPPKVAKLQWRTVTPTSVTKYVKVFPNEQLNHVTGRKPLSDRPTYRAYWPIAFEHVSSFGYYIKAVRAILLPTICMHTAVDIREAIPRYCMGCDTSVSSQMWQQPWTRGYGSLIIHSTVRLHKLVYESFTILYINFVTT